MPAEVKCGLTIGNFDGIHRGHQVLLKKIKQDCEKKGRKLTVATFIPHPNQVIFGKTSFLINSYRERKELLFEHGVDSVIEFDFNEKFKNQSPEQFLQNFIISKIDPAVIYMGHDFTFGANKAGNYQVVQNYCASLPVEIKLMDEHKEEQQKTSSSVIRNYISEGQIKRANKMLGRAFFICGTVKKGQGRGEKLGLPTANLALTSDRIIPARGVYATKVVYESREYLGVTNVGFNPTFSDKKDLQIETNILDFNKSIYGAELKILFLQKMRDEKKFASAEELRQRIALDCQERRKYN